MNDEHVADKTETFTRSLGLRIVIGVIAIIVIGVLAFPLVKAQLTANKNETPSTSAEEQFERGNAHYQAGRWDEAIVAYKKAIELDPNYQSAYANLGVIYYQQQEYNLAASQYQKALELKPDDGEVAYNLGVLYLQQALTQGGQSNNDLLDKAVAQLQEAQKLSPQLAEPYFSLGVAYIALNQKTEAIRAFETFLSLDTNQDPQARQEAEKYLQSLRGQ